MKTKLLVTMAFTTILSTGLYAMGNGQNQGVNKEVNNTKFNMQTKKHMMMKKAVHKKSKNTVMALLKQLNLTDEQKSKIVKIKKDIMSKKVTVDVAFTKDGFDKARFIEIMKQKRENMIESKAEMIDKVYKILTTKQKEQLKVLMELKKEKRMAMMNKRMNF